MPELAPVGKMRFIMRGNCSTLLASQASATSAENPSPEKLKRNSKRHFRLTTDAISKCNRNFDDSQIWPSADNYFKSDFKPNRWRSEFEQARTRNGRRCLVEPGVRIPPSASLIILTLACDRLALTRGPVAFVQHLKFLSQFDHAALGQDAAKVHARINHAIASQQ
jgi:hypothetical protein